MIFLKQLLLGKESCCKGNIVDKKNVNQKLREIMLLINHEYTISLTWIVNHVRYIAYYCTDIKEYDMSVEDQNRYAHCVTLLLPNIEDSKKLITRFISAINFLMNLLNIKTNPFILNELIKFVVLISRERNDNDNFYVDKIFSKFNDEYGWINSDLNIILGYYGIDRNYISINNCDEARILYINSNDLPDTFEMYEFLEVNLREGIKDMNKTLYINLGFFYDEINNETSYVHEWDIEMRKKSLFCF
ncbi:uncharacterized protein LOC126906830 [Daktulosphaira vitifoliae]|uniref:uncharacterized protein LOC126906830 n=1 Tax=Daktulosphaira vitifoliae TaxID=58002 RepID=UPI0021AA31C1|nr:uncharacterized protein LOC126906830 [Daktulosphaira vitifoliae]XP_050543677.1 uncharacterized protein LOC126906830 [Daktulosphaira vitifoliae]XP_050543678.1 uncharacterized protein LOC126906830 [Daktulosphaira vitifoliae]